MKISKLFVLLIFTFMSLGIAPSSHAMRILQLAPLQMNSVHGGVVPYTGPAPLPPAVAPAKVDCGSADMLTVDNYIDSGVDYGLHYLNIFLTNISPILQTITIKVLPGTLVASGNSAGGVYNTPANPASPPTRSISTETAITGMINDPLAPGQSKIYTLTYQCNSAVCKILPLDTSFPATCTSGGVPQACLSMGSYTLFKIEITENKGAVIGNLTTSVHRACGSVDKMGEPPPTMAINGGRAF